MATTAKTSKDDQQDTSRHIDAAEKASGLEVGAPNDKYEQEADAVADRVVNSSSSLAPPASPLQMMPDAAPAFQLMPAAAPPVQLVPEVQLEEEEETSEVMPKLQRKAVSGASGEGDEAPLQQKTDAPSLQRKCAACEQEEKLQPKRLPTTSSGKVQRKCAKCEQEKMVQRHGGGTTHASKGLESKINAADGQGQPLPKNTAQEMGSKIGADFSQVRIHTGGNAEAMNKELGAKAFTHGNNIFFNSGNYNPSSASGKHLLAHELTHTVQQGSAVKTKVQRKTLDDINKEIDALIDKINVEKDDKKRREMIEQLRDIVWDEYGPAAAKKIMAKINDPKITVSVQLAEMKKLLTKGIGKVNAAKGLDPKEKQVKKDAMQAYLDKEDILQKLVKYFVIHDNYEELKAILNDYASTEPAEQDFLDDLVWETRQVQNNNFEAILASMQSSGKAFRINLPDEDDMGPEGDIGKPESGTEGEEEGEGGKEGEGKEGEEGEGKGTGGKGKGNAPPKPDWFKVLYTAVKELIARELAANPTDKTLPDSITAFYVPKKDGSAIWKFFIHVHTLVDGEKQKARGHVKPKESDTAADVLKAIRKKVPALRARLTEKAKQKATQAEEAYKAPKWAKRLKAKVQKKIDKIRKREPDATDLPDSLILIEAEQYDLEVNEAEKEYLFQAWRKKGEGKNIQWQGGTLSYPLSTKTNADKVVELLRKMIGSLGKGKEAVGEVPLIDPEATVTDKNIRPPYPSHITPVNLRQDLITVVKGENTFRMSVDFSAYHYGSLGLLSGASAASQTSYAWEMYDVSARNPTEEELGMPIKGELGWSPKSAWLMGKYKNGKDIRAAGLRKVGSTQYEFSSDVELEFPDYEGDFIIYCWATEKAKPEKNFYRASSESTIAVRTTKASRLAIGSVRETPNKIAELEARIADLEAKGDKKRADELRKVIEALKANEKTTVGASTAKSIKDTDDALDKLKELQKFLKKNPAKNDAGNKDMDPIAVRLHRLGLLDMWILIENSGMSFSEMRKRLQQQKKQLKALQGRIGEFKDDIKGTQYKPVATLVSEVTGETYQLILMLGEEPDSTDEELQYTLIDVSSKQTQNQYDGDSVATGVTDADTPAERSAKMEAARKQAIINAFQDFASSNDYGDGHIAFRVPGFAPLERTWEVKSREGPLETVMRWLGYLAAAAGIAALVLGTVATGGALGAAAAGLGIFGAVAGAGLAAYNIHKRARAHKLEFDAELVLDLVGIVGGVVAGIGAAARVTAATVRNAQSMARWVQAIDRLDDVIQIYGMFEFGSSVILTGVKVQQDIARIQNDPELTDEQKRVMITQVVQQAIQTGGMMMFAGAAMAKNGLPRMRTKVQTAPYKSFEEQGWLKDGAWTAEAPPILRDAQTLADANGTALPKPTADAPSTTKPPTAEPPTPAPDASTTPKPPVAEPPKPPVAEPPAPAPDTPTTPKPPVAEDPHAPKPADDGPRPKPTEETPPVTTPKPTTPAAPKKSPVPGVEKPTARQKRFERQIQDAQRRSMETDGKPPISDTEAANLRAYNTANRHGGLSIDDVLKRFADGKKLTPEGRFYHPHNKWQRDLIKAVDKHTGKPPLNITNEEAAIIKNYIDLKPGGTRKLKDVLKDIRAGKELTPEGRFRDPNAGKGKGLPKVRPHQAGGGKEIIPDAADTARLRAAKQAYERRLQETRDAIKEKSASDADYKKKKEASFQRRHDEAKSKASFEFSYDKRHSDVDQTTASYLDKREAAFRDFREAERQAHSAGYDRGEVSRLKGDALEEELGSAGFGTVGSTSDRIKGNFPNEDGTPGGEAFETAPDLNIGPKKIAEVKAGRISKSDEIERQILKYAQLKNDGYEVTYFLYDGAAPSMLSLMKAHGINYIDLSKIPLSP